MICVIWSIYLGMDDGSRSPCSFKNVVLLSAQYSLLVDRVVKPAQLLWHFVLRLTVNREPEI